MDGAGLRERKKRQTRQLLAETAQRLFRERGFEAVTIAEIARAADVSEGTVFNYFPTKEELFYGGMEAFEERLLDAVRERPAGESALAAFRRVVLDGTDRLADAEVAETIAAAARVVAASRALQAREREVAAEYAARLGALLAAETGAPEDDLEALAAAAALMAVQRAVVGDVHRSVLAGTRGRALAEGTRERAGRAFARLEAGLAGYAVRASDA